MSGVKFIVFIQIINKKIVFLMISQGCIFCSEIISPRALLSRFVFFPTLLVPFVECFKHFKHGKVGKKL